MANMLIDVRDQNFILYEMLHVEDLCNYPIYEDFSRETFEMVLTEAEKMGKEVIFPTLREADREGAKLGKDGVLVPKVLHEVYRRYCEGGWLAMKKRPEYGGQGFPLVIYLAATAWFMHNPGFNIYPGLTAGAAGLIESFGTEAQKNKYVLKMNSGEWGGSMALTEADAGSDVGNLKSKAIRQPDGTFRLQGTKQFIGSCDQDLTKSMVHPVLARIEGDPPGTAGVSIFLMPKFLVNDDGSLGRRNDYFISKLEEKMGMHGSATGVINMGDNNDCYAELLGEERQGLKVMFQMMNEARIRTGTVGMCIGSAAYLHALQYAKERKQGSSLAEAKNPAAPRVPIIEHPDVRRMLLWMKAQIEGMRALLYYGAYLLDKKEIVEEESEQDKYAGMLDVLTPICKAYCSEIGFRVTEVAMQVYGGYGYCAEYPIEQFMRDTKVLSLYEGTNGIQSIDLVRRKLKMKNGLYFRSLVNRMNETITRAGKNPFLKELATDMQRAVDILTEAADFFSKCGQGKQMVPFVNSHPFLMMMGKVVLGWLLLWQAGIAKEKLDGICREQGMDGSDSSNMRLMTENNQEAAFYSGKVISARYFIKHVIPEVESVMKAIKSEDVSPMDIADESFAC